MTPPRHKEIPLPTPLVAARRALTSSLQFAGPAIPRREAFKGVQGAGRRVGLVSPCDLAFDVGVQVVALPDVALEAFAVLAQVVPQAGEQAPVLGTEVSCETGGNRGDGGEVGRQVVVAERCALGGAGGEVGDGLVHDPCECGYSPGMVVQAGRSAHWAKGGPTMVWDLTLWTNRMSCLL